MRTRRRKQIDEKGSDKPPPAVEGLLCSLFAQTTRCEKGKQIDEYQCNQNQEQTSNGNASNGEQEDLKRT
jgi:hypothetical protein